MKSFLIIILAPLIILSSCVNYDPNKNIDEGNIEGNKYISKEIGWTITIPNGWNVIDKDVLEQNVENGKNKIEEITGEIDFSGLKYLISFRKDKINSFVSSSEPLIEEYEGHWEDNNEYQKQVIIEAFTQNQINTDTSSSNLNIDGIIFNVFDIIIYSPTGEHLFNQQMFSSYINGFDFGVYITYNNDLDKTTMQKAFFDSKFDK